MTGLLVAIVANCSDRRRGTDRRGASAGESAPNHQDHDRADHRPDEAGSLVSSVKTQCLSQVGRDERSGCLSVHLK
jgi:hypothetical protein